MNVVQLGTNLAFDSLTPIIIENKERLNKFIAVEPLVMLHESIKKCYNEIPQLIIESDVITTKDTDELIRFYYHLDDGPGYGISSTDKSHILKHAWCNPLLGNEERIEELKLSQISLNSLLEKHELNEIDFLFIDVEGLDSDLIKSIDFSKFNIKHIIYEHLHINNEEIELFLNSHGYYVSGWSGDKDGFSNIAIRK